MSKPNFNTTDATFLFAVSYLGSVFGEAACQTESAMSFHHDSCTASNSYAAAITHCGCHVELWVCDDLEPALLYQLVGYASLNEIIIDG